jgi:mono/diheme cytochrome c family protein
MRTRSLDELGGEDPAVPVGPLHRPGQPCLVCHGDDGPAESRFSLAGTVYQRQDSRTPLGGVKVRFIDSDGAQYEVASNCAGNFYVGATNFEPAWPVWTKMEWRETFQEMASPIFREGSCGACHRDPPTPAAVGHIYMGDGQTDFPGEACK